MFIRKTAEALSNGLLRVLWVFTSNEPYNVLSVFRGKELYSIHCLFSLLLWFSKKCVDVILFHTIFPPHAVLDTFCNNTITEEIWLYQNNFPLLREPFP